MNLSIPLSRNSKTEVESAFFSIDGPKGQNDDRFLDLAPTENGWIAAVADGVGGNVGGARAAELALAALQNVAAGPRLYRDAFRDACGRMRVEAVRHPELARMATTLSAVYISDSTARIGHVGDSRIYHLRGEGIVTRTQDQTEVAELLRQNVLTPGQARRYPRRNVIISYLGPDADFDLFESEFPVETGDKLLLITDGVYKEVRKSELVNLNVNCGTVSQFVREIEEMLVGRGVSDDSTLVAIQI